MVRRRVSELLLTVFLLAAALLVLSPVILVGVFSFGTGASAYADFFVWEPSYLHALTNSVVIAFASSCGAIVTAVLAAYVFAKVRFRGREVLFYLYIIVMMMPFQVTLLPQYMASKTMRIYDTPLALILPGIFAPFAVFLLTQVMKSVPDELIEAARLDTSSTWRVILHILVPAIRPGIVCAWVLVFTEQWNAVAEPLILMETREKYPLAVVLNEVRALDAGSGMTLPFAATVAFAVIPLLLFLIFENEIMEGLGEYRLK